MKPTLEAHVSNLCRELLQARSNAEEFAARTEEMISVLQEHLMVLRMLEHRKMTRKTVYLDPQSRGSTVH